MKKYLIIALLIALVIVAAVLFSSYRKSASSQPEQKIFRSPSMTVHFIDVGQGGAVLVQKFGKNIIYDCGDTFAEEVTRGYLRKLGVIQLDAMVISHAHEDHMGACAHIVRSFPVKKIYHNGSGAKTRAWQNFLDVAGTVEQKVVDEDIHQSEIEILVAYDIRRKRFSNEADNSLLLRLVHGKVRVLLTGDCEVPCEKAVIKGSDVTADVLNVSHHGSNEASHPEFLKTVGANIAVIQAGEKNQYGHPTKPVLDRLEKAGMKVFRTDHSGTIIIYSDGEKFWIETEK